MSDSARGRRRARLPMGLLGMLGLIFAVEGFLARNWQDYSDASQAAWTYAGRMARHRARKAEILCLGDSLMKHGFSPLVVAASTGKRACNLAILGSPPPAAHALLRRALASGARPEAILLDAKTNILTYRPDELIRYWTQVMDLRDLIEFAWTAGDPRLLGQLVLAHYLGSFNDRLAVRASVLDALHGKSSPKREQIALLWRNWTRNQGAMIMPKIPSPDDVQPNEVDQYYPRSWACHPVNAAYLRKTFRLAEAYQIPVYWVIPPISPKAQAGGERLGLDGRFSQFVLAAHARFPNLIVVDGRRSGYPHDVFIDRSHLDRQGAASFSRALASVLARGPDAARASRRWIALPAFQPSPGTVPLEDITQSQIALKAEEGVARR